MNILHTIRTHRSLRLMLLLALTLAAGGYLWATTPRQPAYTPKHPCNPTNLERVITTLTPLHTKLAKPRPGDWLSQHKESGQTFAQYVASKPVVPTAKRRTIYVIPIGPFSPQQKKILETTVEFLGLYYQLPAKLLPATGDKAIPAAARRTHPQWGMKQYLAGWIMDRLLKPKLPKDALCLFGITATDLWPGRGWNFVFGMASLRERIGVQSFYRVLPTIPANATPAQKKNIETLALKRALQTATHEAGHMIGMYHCIAYECNLCGSNNQDESDRRPIAMGPHCLAKLCFACGCDPKYRFVQLVSFYRKHNLTAEADFAEKSYRKLGGDPAKLQPATKAKSK
ncbi:MAG: hypothetical protein HN909_08535 [Phycisphaerales bacterium]|jgi:archaemetzincin|nr:hypothetical protein [Phycisphaerales bacterium]MBT7171801.1 hypothetical protein [Phycisphaerales bacterium]